MEHKLSKPAVICLAASICILLAGMFWFLWYQGMFVSDRSVVIHVEGMRWQGKEFSIADGTFTAGRVIAKSDDGSCTLREIKEDPSHNFVVACFGFEKRLYKANDYTIPQSGEITKVTWGYSCLANRDFIKTITAIDAAKTTSFEYAAEEPLFVLNEEQQLKPVEVAYEDCPIAMVDKGYLGKLRGQWVMTTNASSDLKKVGCYIIPEEHIPVLEKYFELLGFG